MDLKPLRYIVAIAEEQNLTKAAKRLFVSQSTLSLYLRKLEAELGLLLFQRSGNRLSITPAGRLYVETAMKLLSMEDDLYEKLQISKKKQTLNIGISSQMMLHIFSRTFSVFSQSVPNFTANIQEGRAVALLDQLYSDKLDIAIVGRAEIIQNENCYIDVWKREEIWLIIPPNHPYASAAAADYSNPPTADMALFVNENFALSPRDTCDYQIARRIFEDYHMNASIICEVNNTASICHMVQAGICLTAMPSYCIPRDMGLLVCKPSHPYYRYLLFLQRKDHRPSPEETRLLHMLFESYIHYYEKSTLSALQEFSQ